MPFYTHDNFEPDFSLGYLTRRVNQMGSAALEPLFSEFGLSGVQWSALVSIWFGRGGTCAELARDLGHDKGAMTRLIDALEANGLVTRARDRTDRRIVNLALTDEGRVLTLRCREGVIARWNDWLTDWDPAEVETLIALMQKLRGTLNDATGQEGPVA